MERETGKKFKDTSIPITINALQIHRAVRNIVKSGSNELPKLPEDQVQWLKNFLEHRNSNAMEVSTDIDDSVIENLPMEVVEEVSEEESCKFHCKNCDKKFEKKYNYEEHIGHEHNIKCPDCQLTFAKIRYLTAHQGISHPDTVFKCERCGGFFKDQKQLNKHQKHRCKERTEPMDQ